MERARCHRFMAITQPDAEDQEGLEQLAPCNYQDNRGSSVKIIVRDRWRDSPRRFTTLNESLRNFVFSFLVTQLAKHVSDMLRNVQIFAAMPRDKNVDNRKHQFFIAGRKFQQKYTFVDGIFKVSVTSASFE